VGDCCAAPCCRIRVGLQAALVFDFIIISFVDWFTEFAAWSVKRAALQNCCGTRGAGIWMSLDNGVALAAVRWAASPPAPLAQSGAAAVDTDMVVLLGIRGLQGCQCLLEGDSHGMNINGACD